jgi:two-component system phosphate regulon sensor histidine kinase PhoR
VPDARVLSSPDAPLLATALARSFELVAGIALFTLAATAGVVLLIPNSASSRVGFAVELVGLGVALVILALLLSRRSARAVMRPLDLLDAALVSITAGDLTVQVQLGGAAAEIQFVGKSVNTMVRELARLRTVEIERTKDQRVRRELAEMVHASLDLDHVVQRAVEVVGAALDVDRVHIRLFDRDVPRLAAQWRRSDDVVSMDCASTDDDRSPLVHLIGVTEDDNAVVIDDALDGARFSVEQRRSFDELHVRAAVKYPLIVGERVAGVLVASQQDAPRHWSDSEVALMQGFAREIGRALDHALAFELQEKMLERLGVLDRAKNDFLSEVSRELRGPLASVLGYIELLADDSTEATPEHRRMLTVVERNGDKLLVLIDNLLIMSQLEAGTFHPKLAPVDFAGVLKRVYDEALPAATAGALEFAVDLEPTAEMVGDEKQIERALQNLVSNAVKFTPGGGRVDVGVRRDGNEVVIVVRDTGIGIAEDDQDELFARFFSAKGAPRRETSGTGLGLYIVKQIVDGLGGTITAESHAGWGSTFTMRFPTRPPPPAAASTRLDREPRGPLVHAGD